MGAWSEESYSNDRVWDRLCSNNLNPRRIGQKKVSLFFEGSLFRTILRRPPSKVTWEYLSGMETQLGCVVFYLSRGMEIPERVLRNSSRYAFRLARSRKYLRCWTKGRKACLLAERKQIRDALAHGCRGKRGVKPYYVEDVLATL